MADYQQIVDEIRYALQSESCELTEELQNAAREYSLACREVNQRVRKIGSYLDNGLRSEAIQLAEGPPDIEELVSILNFPEQEEWADVVAIYDLPRSEPLQLRVIEQLKEAQLIELPLLNLMSRHRLLALHRAPLNMRLSTLRELQLADPETPSWEEDVREFEKARFQEIADGARMAQRSGDLGLLKQLQEEIAGTDWLETPPASLIKMVKANAGELTRKSAQKQLEELAVELDNAFGELDFPRAKGLSTRWKEMLRQAGSGFQSPLLEQVAPVLGWVHDEETREAAEKQYQHLIAKMEAELDQTSSLEDLDQIVHEIQRLDRDLPELLAIRYKNRRESIQLSQSRVHRLQMGTALAVVVAIAVGIGFLVRNQVNANEVDRLAQQVEDLLDHQQWEEAQKLLATRTDITHWDRLTELQSRVNEDLKKEADRKGQLTTLLATAQDAESFREAMVAIEQAKKLATTPGDKVAISDLQRKREKTHNELMAAREAVLGESILQAGNLLQKIDDSMGSGPGDAQVGESLIKVASVIGELQQQTPEMRPEFSSQIRLLDARRKELDELRKQRLVYEQRFQDLTSRSFIAGHDLDSGNAVSRYSSALLEFADAIKQEQAAELYRERTAEDRYWKSALLWSSQITNWKETWPNDLTEMTKRISECRKYLSENAGAPDSVLVKRYADQLEAVISITGHVDGSGAGLQARLLRIFSSALIEKSWCLKTKDDRVFYVPKAITVSDTGLLNFQFYVGYGEEDQDTQKLVKPQELVSKEASPSPSQLLAKFVKQQLTSLPPEGWNGFCLELCTKILDDKELNDYLKLDLLKRCLELSANGDVFLKEQLEPHLKLLQEAAINPLARWMNPDDADGKRAVNDSQQVLSHFRRMKDLGDAWKDADRQRAHFLDSMTQSVSMVGWLQAGPKWTCHVDKTQSMADCDLLVAFIPSGATASEWRLIGQIANGEVQFKPGNSEFLAPGRPVFAVQKRPVRTSPVSMTR
ncbi:hypothetical protein [Planctomicrobium sp. SH527]|uniref:hypothetical protein n=1 Tax=Planctomicrobium sp. SH527 TaxID=3448123 RepID=UPI003F5B9280